MTLAVRNLSRDSKLAEHALDCRSFLSRAKGLLGTGQKSAVDGCWLVPCSSVHTFGMARSIDVYFLSKKNEVLAIRKNLKPNRFSPYQPGTHSILELFSGKARACEKGDVLSMEKQP